MKKTLKQLEQLNAKAWLEWRMNTVTVVRCKSCEHSRDADGALYCSYGECSGREVADTFFCANGKRKETQNDCP